MKINFSNFFLIFLKFFKIKFKKFKFRANFILIFQTFKNSLLSIIFLSKHYSNLIFYIPLHKME